MQSRHTFSVFISLIIILYFVFMPSSALACSFISLPKYSLQEHIASSSVILEGTIIEIKQEENSFEYTAKIQINRYFKDSGPSVVTITGFGTGLGDCRERGYIGRHDIYFANRAPFGLLRLTPSTFTATHPPEKATEIIQIIGHEPILPQDDIWQDSMLPWVFLLPAGIVLAFLAWFAFQKRRKFLQELG